MEALVTRKLIGKDQLGYGVDSVILEGRNGNFEPENSFKEEVTSLSKEETAKLDVGYLEWTKVKQTELSRTSSKKMS